MDLNQTSGNDLYSLDQLNSISNNNATFVKKMIELFLQIVPESLSQIKSGYENEDLKLVFLHAHKIKSNLNHFDAKSSHLLAAKIEDLAKNHPDQKKDIFDCIEVLDKNVQLILENLQIRYSMM